MTAWKRRTEEIPFESLPPEMILAINQHIEQHNLGPILSDYLICIQTNSEKVKKTLFGGAEIVLVGAVVTPRWLVWTIRGTKTQIAVLSAQLSDIIIQDYDQTPLARMIPDSGIEVNGRFIESSEHVSAFIDLQDGSAGHKFKGVIIKAAQEAKK